MEDGVVPCSTILTHDQAVNQEKNLYGVFGRCYQLNKGLINMSFCHPDVLMHKAAIKRIKQLNQVNDVFGSKSAPPSCVLCPLTNSGLVGRHDTAR